MLATPSATSLRKRPPGRRALRRRRPRVRCWRWPQAAARRQCGPRRRPRWGAWHAATQPSSLRPALAQGRPVLLLFICSASVFSVRDRSGCNLGRKDCSLPPFSNSLHTCLVSLPTNSAKVKDLNAQATHLVLAGLSLHTMRVDGKRTWASLQACGCWDRAFRGTLQAGARTGPRGSLTSVPLGDCRQLVHEGLTRTSSAQVGEHAGVRQVVEGLTASGGRMRVLAVNLLNLLLAHPLAAPRALALLQVRAARCSGLPCPRDVSGRSARASSLRWSARAPVMLQGQVKCAATLRILGGRT